MSAVVDSESRYLNEIDCYNMCIHKHSVYVALSSPAYTVVY